MNEKIFIDMSNAIGTGNIISTAEDLFKWNQYLYEKSDNKIKKIMLKNYFKDEDGDFNNLGLTTYQTNLGAMIGFQFYNTKPEFNY